jgi:hypothetical protein
VSSVRQKLGCWVNERWRAELVLRQPRAAHAFGLSWRSLRNRAERLRPDSLTGGMECLWQDSSVLTATRIFPEMGPRLLQHALEEWPIRLHRPDPEAAAVTPAVSILIPIGGTARLPQFELALAAARSQEGTLCEVIVVEQSPEALLAGKLPADVRYFHQARDEGAGGFNKSAALNLAAREARGESVIVLDADYLLPARFAAECQRVLQAVEAVRPARFLFYLDEASTTALYAHREPSRIVGIERVVANNPTPVALRTSTYRDIGGHDEGYVGWGGEDTEFLDRLRSRPICEAGWMPVVHAWHAPAAKKVDGDRNAAFHRARMALTTAERVARLRSSR